MLLQYQGADNDWKVPAELEQVSENKSAGNRCTVVFPVVKPAPVSTEYPSKISRQDMCIVYISH